jgi:hypothetical protein
LGHPNDTTWQSQAGEQAAQRQAQQEAASAAASTAQQPQQQAEPDICNDPNVPMRDPRRRVCDD